MKAGNRVFGAGVGLISAASLAAASTALSAEETGLIFQTSSRCVACHNGIYSTAGKDVSLGHAWGPTMMANSARDPYWQAGVRRETLEHPMLAREIENECSRCHMPMANVSAHVHGRAGRVFAHFSANSDNYDSEGPLARDGVSCSLCHQIQATHLGERKSLTGGFVIDTQTSQLPRREFGLAAVDRGRAKIMSSASQMTPVKGDHLSSSELCATCHTLYTQALDAQGRIIGELPEQVPYQEWQHSAYRRTRSCQSCHMPQVQGAPYSSVAGLTHSELYEHQFLGGNAFMLGLFSRYGATLTAQASTQQFELARLRTVDHLRSEPAALTLSCVSSGAQSLAVQVQIKNLTGHKLPTAYPSRRVWIHLRAESSDGTLLFESGALKTSGAIVGNDNDEDAGRFEPHHERISRSVDVAIYESILGAQDGRVTTGLLTASQYLKDNRILPIGFDKSTAPREVAVHGGAGIDADFVGGSDRITYEVHVPMGTKPRVTVELLYQTIGFRWATNLKAFDTRETSRFVDMYQAMSAGSAVTLARVLGCP